MSAKEYKLADSTGYLLRSIGFEMKRQFVQRVEQYGVTSEQCPPLMVLYGGMCGTPTEMAKAMGIDVGAVSRLVDRLEAKGFVARVPHEHDKRSVRIELTEEGRRIVPKLLDASNEINNRVFAGALGKTRSRELHKALEKVADHLYQSSSVLESPTPNRRK